MTLQGELDDAVAVLAAAGVGSPRSDAEQLAAHVTGGPRWRLALTSDLSPEQRECFHRLVACRSERVPLQHLVGSAGFRYLTLAVGPGVFVPRPETECVVGWAVAAVAADGARGPVCVDLCTGSGAIAFALATELLGARVHAVECDPAALVWTRRNLVALEDGIAAAGGTVTVHHADVGIPAVSGGSAPAVRAELVDLLGQVDLVVSNPPYLGDDERDLVEPEVGRHDPPAALWAGPDGLAGVRVVAEVAADLLRAGGRLVIEHSDRHGASAPQLLAASGWWDDIYDHPDLAGRDRFVTATRRCSGAAGRM